LENKYVIYRLISLQRATKYTYMLYINRSGKTQSVFRLVYGLDYSVFDSHEGLYLQNNTDLLSCPTSLLYFFVCVCACVRVCARVCVCTQVHNHVYNTASRKMHYIKLHLFGGSFNEPTIQYYNVSVTEKVRNNGKIVRGKPQSRAEKPVPVTVRPPPAPLPQIPHGVVLNRTQAYVTKDLLLSASVMPRFVNVLLLCNIFR
jgi:hypothetical protein